MYKHTLDKLFPYKTSDTDWFLMSHISVEETQKMKVIIIILFQWSVASYKLDHTKTTLWTLFFSDVMSDKDYGRKILLIKTKT